MTTRTARRRPVAARAGLAVALAVFVAAGDASAVPDVAKYVVRLGDPFAGDLVKTFGQTAINDSGDWAVIVRTFSPSFAADQGMIRSGSEYRLEGAALAQPAGASIDAFGPFEIDQGGNLFQVLHLQGTSGLSDDTGLYRNNSLLLQEGDPASGFAGGTTYRGFLNVKCNAAGTLLAALVAVDDPTIASPMDLAVVVFQISGASIVGTTIVAKEGDVLAGQTQPVVSFGTTLHQLAINASGSVLYFADIAGPDSSDGAIYLDGALVAQEGGYATADSSRTYQSLAGRPLALDDAGITAFTADLDDSDTNDLALVHADSIEVLERDRPYQAEGYNQFVNNFGPPEHPIFLDGAGTLMWTGHFLTGTPFAVGKGGSLLIRGPAGSTPIDGAQPSGIITGAGTQAMSRSNEWVAASFVRTQIPGLAIAARTPVDAPVIEASGGEFLRAFPSPSFEKVRIRYALDRESAVRLEVYDVAGRLVTALEDGARARGEHTVDWNGTDRAGRRVSPGLYFLRLTAGDRELRSRVTLVR